jgi:hypothetical protein
MFLSFCSIVKNIEWNGIIKIDDMRVHIQDIAQQLLLIYISYFSNKLSGEP